MRIWRRCELRSGVGARSQRKQPSCQWSGGQNDLFRARLDQIVDTNHALAKLGRGIDWRFLEERLGAV